MKLATHDGVDKPSLSRQLPGHTNSKNFKQLKKNMSEGAIYQWALWKQNPPLSSDTYDIIGFVKQWCEFTKINE